MRDRPEQFSKRDTGNGYIKTVKEIPVLKGTVSPV
jgi:hypothetical protein